MRPESVSELEARKERKSGSKAWLRRQLHAAVVWARLKAKRAQRRELFVRIGQ